jgi:hypothetical protein
MFNETSGLGDHYRERISVNIHNKIKEIYTNFEQKNTPFGVKSAESKLETYSLLRELFTTLATDPEYKTLPKYDDPSFRAYLFRMLAEAYSEISDLYLDVYNTDIFSEWGFSGRNFLQNFRDRNLLNGNMLNTIDTVPILRGIHEKLQITNHAVRSLYLKQYKNKENRDLFRVLSS